MRFRDEDDDVMKFPPRREDTVEMNVLRLKEILCELDDLAKEAREIVQHMPEANRLPDPAWVLQILQSLDREEYGSLSNGNTMVETIQGIERNSGLPVSGDATIQTRGEILSHIGNDWC
jgi:hypothetical protein